MTTLPLMPTTPGDTAQLRTVFGCFPSGVTAVCADVDGAPVGMAASSFTSVSVGPPLVSVCVQNSSETWPRLRTADRIGLSVLSDGQDGVCRSLSTKNGDRFAGVRWTCSADGSIFIEGAAAMLDCTLYGEMPAGDHAIALLQIRQVHAEVGVAPLVFHGSRFRRLAEV
ncbi:flavin reductase family protein [Pseudonocardia endophytica]|uniref:Flavin reductase (DIM6/NTAB) family NADH-FMN oxidoreductase RutF n=1 Tax=Pseudonocardia endophytica TaxID=401976 RepID=A0A4R1I933_PSEEN|nr:flavin reductase family protein [Pseudonocardia endophytica]TCK26722.1 flavin reductase (DIM6/NTAB) family NADH-FMN oxidoreductase RutF [Pseudonocardia endophytica]